MRLKELKIFVEENKDHPKFKSKIGWRATYDGKLYGDQLYTTPPSEAKLVEVINLFLGQAIGVIEVLENESSADVVEVVRCKDCKWCKEDNWDGEILYGCDCAAGLNCAEPNGFCSYGERKDK